MTLSMWSPQDGSDEWLSPVDGALAVQLFRHLQSTRTQSNAVVEPVLEVGVWKGAWVSTLLMNTSVEKAFGVDPYPSLDHIRTQMLSNLDRLNIANRFELHDSLESLPIGQRYSLIHIDGEHSESAVERELQFATDHVASDGVIIVDDFLNFWFPGVPSAVFRNLERLGLRIVAITRNKAYLSLRVSAEDWYEATVEACTRLDLEHSSHFDPTGSVISYEKPTTVLGQPVLLIGGTRSHTAPRRARVRKLLPPILVDVIRCIRQRRR